MKRTQLGRPLVVLFLCFCASPGQAQIQVQQIDPTADLSPLEGPNVQVHRLPRNPPDDSGIPTKSELNILLQEAGLTQAMKGWDSLDRHVFYIKAHALSIAMFLNDYPKLNPDSLRKFHGLVHP